MVDTVKTTVKSEGTGKTSSSNTTMREVEGNVIKDGEAPGSLLQNKGVHLEGLGHLSDFPTDPDVNQREGFGEHCVVLSDVLTGADGESYFKGDVKRLSLLVSGYGSKELPKDHVKAQIRRMFELRAVRLATDEEIAAGKVDISFQGESHEVQDERAKRIAAEKRVKELEAQIGTASADLVVPEKTDIFDE